MELSNMMTRARKSTCKFRSWVRRDFQSQVEALREVRPLDIMGRKGVKSCGRREKERGRMISGQRSGASHVILLSLKSLWWFQSSPWYPRPDAWPKA